MCEVAFLLPLRDRVNVGVQSGETSRAAQPVCEFTKATTGCVGQTFVQRNVAGTRPPPWWWWWRWRDKDAGRNGRELAEDG